jgi:hypothetical protein
VASPPEGAALGSTHLRVVDGGDLDEALLEIGALLRADELERLELGVGESREQVVEGVVVALLGALRDGTRLFEQIAHDVGTHQPVALVKVNARKLAETRRVVVHDGLGVAKGLEDRVAVEHLLCEAREHV